MSWRQRAALGVAAVSWGAAAAAAVAAWGALPVVVLVCSSIALLAVWAAAHLGD
jgi:hypothetical protein